MDFESQDEIQKEEDICNELFADTLLSDEPSEVSSSDTEPVVESPEDSDELPEYQVRTFRVPKLNIQASTYVDMVDLEGQLYEPPLTMRFSDDEIKRCIDTPLIVPNYPNHTQAVERAVKLTTEAASRVTGFEQRHGMICQRIKARKMIPKFKSKKDALPLLEKT